MKIGLHNEESGKVSTSLNNSVEEEFDKYTPGEQLETNDDCNNENILEQRKRNLKRHEGECTRNKNKHLRQAKLI